MIPKFFEDLAITLKNVKNAYSFLFFADANGTLGKQSDDHVGSHGAEHEDHAGECLRALVRGLNLFIPSTFKHIVGDSPVKSFGRKRIDYVCIPMAWSEDCLAAGTMDAIAEQTPKLEHAPVTTTVRLPSGLGLPWVKRKSPIAAFCDDADKVSKFASEVLALDVTPKPDVSETLQHMTNLFCSTLKEHFPLAAVPFRKHTIISDTSRYYINQRKQTVTSIRKANVEIKVLKGLLAATSPELLSAMAQVAPMIIYLKQMNSAVRSHMWHTATRSS